MVSIVSSVPFRYLLFYSWWLGFIDSVYSVSSFTFSYWGVGRSMWTLCLVFWRFINFTVFPVHKFRFYGKGPRFSDKMCVKICQSKSKVHRLFFTVLLVLLYVQPHPLLLSPLFLILRSFLSLKFKILVRRISVFVDMFSYHFPVFT